MEQSEVDIIVRLREKMDALESYGQQAVGRKSGHATGKYRIGTSCPENVHGKRGEMVCMCKTAKQAARIVAALNATERK